MTDDADIRIAQSMMDYIFRRLALDYLPFETRSSLGLYTASERARALESGEYTQDAGTAPKAPAAPWQRLRLQVSPLQSRLLR